MIRNNLDLGFSEQCLQMRHMNIPEKEIRCLIPLVLCCGLVNMALSILVNLVVQTLWDPCVNSVAYIPVSL